MTVTADEIAGRVNGDIIGDGSCRITGTAPFHEAGPSDLTFAETPSLLTRLDRCRAGAVMVSQDETPAASPGNPPTLILCDQPRLRFFQVMTWMYPEKKMPPGFSPLAVAGIGFSAGADVSVGPHVSIGDEVSLGRNVTLMSGCFLGDGVSIGDDTVIFPNVTIMERTVIGRRVRIQSGSVIGSDGFGFTPALLGHEKIPHRGVVEIGDDVEIGAGNTIDRGTMGKTCIGNGVKTDNQVHIAHNVTIGDHTLVVAQAGVAGSTTIGRNVIIAGKAGVSGHLHIGDGAVVGPFAGVARNVPPGDVVSGVPDMPHKKWLKVGTLLPRLPEMRRLLLSLERKVKEIEKRFETE